MVQYEPQLVGPFIGYVTDTAAKIWLQLTDLGLSETRSVNVTLHESVGDAITLRASASNVSQTTFGVGIVTFEGLRPDTLYYYRVWKDAANTSRIELNGLVDTDLRFRTLPTNGFDDHLDFLLMSCHNPETSKNDGADGCAVWAQIPEIMSQNKNVRFAVLAGDQIYADEVEVAVRKEPDLTKRQNLYLGVYKRFWDNINYRRVLCSVPSVLMWDDHDITDGWGSREDAYPDEQSSTFEQEWINLFEAARSTFKEMQGSRNPPPLSDSFTSGFDYCFKIGRAGFVVSDLRSNRNVRKRRMLLAEQFDSIRKWVQANKSDLDVLFFVSTVVFSHGSPEIERGIIKYWFLVLDFVHWVAKFRPAKPIADRFNQFVGDLRDDINDSWGSDANKPEADRALDFLFELQNPSNGERPINVVILSGDIHTPRIFDNLFCRSQPLIKSCDSAYCCDACVIPAFQLDRRSDFSPSDAIGPAR
jgi:alkaline phosphatase D